MHSQKNLNVAYMCAVNAGCRTNGGRGAGAVKFARQRKYFYGFPEKFLQNAHQRNPPDKTDSGRGEVFAGRRTRYYVGHPTSIHNFFGQRLSVCERTTLTVATFAVVDTFHISYLKYNLLYLASRFLHFVNIPYEPHL